jgi:hypothetical protein
MQQGGREAAQPRSVHLPRCAQQVHVEIGSMRDPAWCMGNQVNRLAQPVGQFGLRKGCHLSQGPMLGSQLRKPDRRPCYHMWFAVPIRFSVDGGPKRLGTHEEVGPTRRQLSRPCFEKIIFLSPLGSLSLFFSHSTFLPFASPIDCAGNLPRL